MEINAYIDELSVHLKERIEPTMDEYGIKLASFYVNEISIPEEDPSVIKLKDALSKRAEMDIIGYNYQQERTFDTLEGAATNKGTNSSAIMGAGLGLGMGVGMGGTVGGAFGSLAQELNTSGSSSKECPQCHVKVPEGQRFCGSCGCDTYIDSGKKDKKIVCAECGAQLSSNLKFCPECGDKYDPCPECGADLPKGVKACSECGYTLPMKCSRCNADIPKGVKFCPECGESLVRKCPKCNTAIDGTPKFCPECGEKL